MYDNWDDLEKLINGCNKCDLCKNRMNILFGWGNKEADVMFIGEAPSNDEDANNKLFACTSGKLLNMAFEGLEINKDNIYYTNVVKCKVNAEQVPKVNEISACLNYLRNQVILIKPKIIVLLGNTALKTILGNENNMLAVRGNWFNHKGIFYMPTWHPAALLRDENKKIEFWEDLKKVKQKANNENMII